MAEVVDSPECPIVTIYLFEHVAKSGCCDICQELDGWFFAEEEDEPPHEIKQHDFCRCVWAMHTISGLWREKAEEIMNSHADLKAGYEEAVAQIAFRAYDIAELNEVLGGQKEEKAVQDDIAAQNTQEANDCMDAAQQIIDENDELTEEQQDMVDELLWRAEECLQRAEDALALAESIQQEIYVTEQQIRNKEDERDAQIYIRDDYLAKIMQLEPCLELGIIEDKAEEMAGARLILEF